MLATKWHKRRSDAFRVEPHVSPTGNVHGEPGVKVVLVGPVGSDDRNWLEVSMTAGEARELANRLLTHSKIAEENRRGVETPQIVKDYRKLWEQLNADTNSVTVEQLEAHVAKAATQGIEIADATSEGVEWRQLSSSERFFVWKPVEARHA